MSGQTGIEYCNATWPVVSGCTKVSEGCRNCWAARLAATRLRNHPRYRGLARMRDGLPEWTGKVRLHPDLLDQPLRWRKSKRIFVCSQADLFHEKVPTEFIAQVFGIASLTEHNYLMLTKRPERMLEILNSLTLSKCQAQATDIVPDRKRGGVLPWPHRHINGPWPLPNVWLGVSVEDQKTADERIPLLLQTPAAVRFVSYEPAISPVDFSKWMRRPPLSWIICGGESGPNARPLHPAWFRAVRDASLAAGVPFFFKQRGEWSWDTPEPFVRFPPTHHLCQHGNLQDIRDYSWKCVAGGCSVYAIAKVGKKRAGRLLDGRTWDEFPVLPLTERTGRGAESETSGPGPDSDPSQTTG